MTTQKLGALAEFRNGLNYTDADNGSGLAVVGVSDFKDKVVIDTDRLQQLSLSALSKPDALIQEGDILFVRSNGNRELIGRSVYVNAEPAMPTSHSGFTIRCRFRDRRCYPRYYAYLFRGSIIRHTLSAQGGGTNISNLNQQILAELDVPVPDFWIQERIAGILSAYDDLIEVNQRRIAILEEMARRLFDEWFIQPLGKRLPIPGDRLDQWRLPSGWSFSTLIDTADVTMGQSPASSEYNEDIGGMPFHQGVSDFEGRFHRNRLFLRPDLTWNRNADKGDVLFSVRAPVGRIAIALESLALGRGLCAIRDLRGQQAFLMTHLLMSFPHQDMFGGGTIYKAVTKDDVYSIPILLPPEGLKTAFEKLASPMWEQLKTLTLANMQLRNARDLLLPKLVSGEIDVSVTQETFAEAAE